MAISFKGSIPSPIVLGNDATTQNLFVLTNKVGSRVNVILRRASAQGDTLTALASVMPVLKACRATSISGGIILDKAKYDTLLSSSESVEIRTPLLEGSPITANAGDTMWQQYCSRIHTAVEQVIADDSSLLPRLVETNNFIIRPGESILFRVVGSLVTSNPALSTNWYIQCMWEEDEIATFAISGTVTLSGSPVSGARVVVVEADDQLMTNAVLVEIITTPAGGTWASSIKTGKVGAAFVQYTSGGTFYTAYGSPYLE